MVPPAASSRGAGLQPAAVPDWVAASSLIEHVPDCASLDAKRQALYRALRGTPASEKRVNVRPALVHKRSTVARLFKGLTVEAMLTVGLPQTDKGRKLPPQAGSEWSEHDFVRFHGTCNLVDAWHAHRAAANGKRDEELFPAFHERWQHFAADLGLKLSTRSLQRYARRVSPLSPPGVFDGNVDSRGRPKVAIAPMSDEAWERFMSIVVSDNKITLVEAHRFVDGEAREKDWDWPGIAAVTDKLNKLPDGALAAKREGPWQFEATYVPKVARDYAQIGAGEIWSLDCRTLDFPCRVPDARREWREQRLTACGVADCRSRSRRIVLRATEHSDGILAGLKRAILDWGAPREIICDNGKGYIAALLGNPEVESLCKTFGITLHRSLKDHAWAKQIESLWNRSKEQLDRWLPSFVGGSPDERPEDRAKDNKANLLSLPTEDEVNAWFALNDIEWHATPISGSGTLGLSPNLIFEQFRSEHRPVDPATVEALCRRAYGPIKKTPRGFRLNHLYYGRWDEAVWRLPAGEYFLLKDPERNDNVIIADADKRPLCVATNRLLRGTTDEERREAARLQARYRRIMREAVPARDYLRQTETQQILAAKARHAQAREAELRNSLPAPPAPQISIVRPDLVEPSRKVVAAIARAETAPPAQSSTGFQPVEDASNAPSGGFKKLAAKAHVEELQEHAAAVKQSRWAKLNYESEAAG